ncbi:MAG TPA: cupin-like domain-containing protein [Solimonas sp.]|nr:cupin-like domain-containing protein [Solimonas sp.]
MECVQEVERLTTAEWLRVANHPERSRRPVVLTDAARAWPALRKWSPEFFRQRYGHLRQIAGGREWTLSEYLDLMRRSTAADPAPYPFGFDVERDFPELLADVSPPLQLGRRDRTGHPLLMPSMLSATKPHEIFFGGAGSIFRVLHYDALHLHGHITQIMGSKDFYLYGPEQSPYMYPRVDNPKLSEVDILAPDFERHPEFRKARPVHARIAPGETIFFPVGWWHYTRMDGPSIAYGAMTLDYINWQSFLRDCIAGRRAAGTPAWKAAAVMAYGQALGLLMDAQEALAALM